jgi:hypothetical protein
MVNPERVRRLISEIIRELRLDLRGLVVFTEAATGNYAVTPVIAAMAGAEVYAIARGSRYGTAEAAKAHCRRLAQYCGVQEQVTMVTRKDPRQLGRAHIVTNLGMVRPIDESTVAMMGPQAVVPAMCEAWEVRPGDVDLEACAARGIPVMGTDEDAPDLRVFDYVGPLVQRMLMELEIEVHKSRIAVVGRDKFGRRIAAHLLKGGASVFALPHLRGREHRRRLRDCDAIIIADYSSEETIIGRYGQITAGEIKKSAPGISIIHLCGEVDVVSLTAEGIPHYPPTGAGKRRMGLTFAALGPRPVIELHAAGLKVGEAMARARLLGLSQKKIQSLALRHSPAQIMKQGKRINTR